MNYQLKPIKNDEEHRLALEHFDTLIDFDEGTPQSFERGVLGILIAKYEDETIPIPVPSLWEAIKFRLEQAGLPRSSAPR